MLFAVAPGAGRSSRRSWPATRSLLPLRGESRCQSCCLDPLPLAGPTPAVVRSIACFPSLVCLFSMARFFSWVHAVLFSSALRCCVVRRSYTSGGFYKRNDGKDWKQCAPPAAACSGTSAHFFAPRLLLIRRHGSVGDAVPVDRADGYDPFLTTRCCWPQATDPCNGSSTHFTVSFGLNSGLCAECDRDCVRIGQLNIVLHDGKHCIDLPCYLIHVRAQAWCPSS